MKTFNDHLQNKLKDPEFRKLYEEERELLEISLQVTEARKKQRLSQQELAEKAHISQQQLSKIENGKNFNISTLLKLLDVLNLKIDLRDKDSLKRAS